MAMDLMKQVLANLQEKYKQVSQILDLTKEMEKALKSNDEVSLEMLVDMRQKIMNTIDKLDLDTKNCINKMPPVQSEKFSQLLMPTGDIIKLDNPMETNIFDTNKRIGALLKKIIVINDGINKKLF